MYLNKYGEVFFLSNVCETTLSPHFWNIPVPINYTTWMHNQNFWIGNRYLLVILTDDAGILVVFHDLFAQWGEEFCQAEMVVDRLMPFIESVIYFPFWDSPIVKSGQYLMQILMDLFWKKKNWIFNMNVPTRTRTTFQGPTLVFLPCDLKRVQTLVWCLCSCFYHIQFF